jgi:ADP-heptose:LPS heptosyltransferase
MMIHAVPRIVIVRPDHLGDVLLTLPAVEGLRKAIPEAHITFITARASVDAARLSPDIDAVIGVPFPALNQPLEATSWATVAASEGDRLRDEFDIAILPRPDDPWSGRLTTAASVPVRLGYDLPRTRTFLTHRMPSPRREHVVITAARLVSAAAALLGVGHAHHPERGRPARLHIAPEHEAEALRVLNRLETRSIVVLHPAAGWALKHWSVRRWGELALVLHRYYGITSVVTGERSDHALISAIVAASDGSAVSLAGHLSLGGLAALYRRVQLVIAIDSGPMHLAALLGTPVIGLYGPADPVQFAPWSVPGSYHIVHVQLPCSPCGNLLDPPCGVRRNPACMTGVSLKAVVGAVEAMLARRAQLVYAPASNDGNT